MQNEKKLYEDNKWKHDTYIIEQKKKDSCLSECSSFTKYERIIPLHEKYNIDSNDLKSMLDDGISLTAIAETFNTSPQNIKLACYELGYDPQPVRVLPYIRHKISREWFYKKRIEEHESFESLSKVLNITAITVKDIYTSLNLDREEMSYFLHDIQMDSNTFLNTDERTLQNEGIDISYIRFAKSQIEKIEREKTIDVSQVDQLYKDGETPRKIGQLFQVPEENVWRIIRENNIHKNNVLEELSVDQDWMRKHFIDQRMNFTQIARLLNTSPAMVRAACVFIGLEKPIVTAGERHGISYDKAKAIVETPNLSHVEIAKQMGVSIVTSYKIMQDYGLSRPHNHLSESEAEIKWERFLDELHISYDAHQFCLSGESSTSQEIDILIPDFAIGIEISPVYTHNSDEGPFYGNKQGLPKPSNYHQKKAIAAEAIGINLVHIFDWYDEEKIKNLLRNLLHKNERIFARKTSVRKLNNKEERVFFEKSHLQGYVKSEFCYALIYENDIVAAMSLGKPRFGNKDNVEWELLRFASAPGTTIVGGASKLFKYFVRQHAPKSIMSYCNYDISNGNLYKVLGFQYIRTVRPSYYWVKNAKDKTCYSWNLIKSKGVDNILGTNYGRGRSNIELMLAEGFTRVYNCGNKVFIWTNSNEIT